jgi:probable rRNA maturation factor
MIYVDNRQYKINIKDDDIEILKEAIYTTLKEEGVLVPCEVSLVLVDNEEIKNINNETRGISKETDVLSFPMLDYEEGKIYRDCYIDYKFDETYMDGEELVLGDIVLSLEKALEQSVEYDHSFQRESSYLVVHSVLHLLGYDHMEDNEKSRMREREEYVLNILDIRR